MLNNNQSKGKQGHISKIINGIISQIKLYMLLSNPNKSGSHDKTEKLLKVTINTDISIIFSKINLKSQSLINFQTF